MNELLSQKRENLYLCLDIFLARPYMTLHKLTRGGAAR